jgi:hypothetical protein
MGLNRHQQVLNCGVGGWAGRQACRQAGDTTALPLPPAPAVLAALSCLCRQVCCACCSCGRACSMLAPTCSMLARCCHSPPTWVPLYTGSKGALATAPKASTALAREYVHSHTLSKRQLPLPPTTPLRDHAPGVSETPVQASPQDAVAGSNASTEQHQLPAVGTAAAIAEQQQEEAQQQQQNQQAGAAAPTKPLAVPLFLDEALPSFFRRPAWSPCGALLALPAGISPHISAGSGGGGGAAHATYLYARGQWCDCALPPAAGWACSCGRGVLCCGAAA